MEVYEEKKGKSKTVKLVVAGIIVVAVAICLVKCLVKVPAGYVGIVYNMNGGVETEFLSQGWHFVLPTKSVYTYSIGIEQSYLTSRDEGDSEGNDSFEVPSSDGKGLTVDLTFTYRYDADKVTDTFVRFKGQNGEEVKNSFIKPNIISWSKEVTAQYPVTEILSNRRAQMNLELTEYLKGKFEPYGIIIENVTLIDINPDEETRTAIQKKVTAQQELEVAQIQAQTAKVEAEKDKQVAIIEAEKKRDAAKIEAEQKKIAAEGEAEARKIEAEAEAEANKMISESLTKELIEKLKYEKWNGEVSKYAGETGGIIIKE